MHWNDSRQRSIGAIRVAEPAKPLVIAVEYARTLISGASEPVAERTHQIGRDYVRPAGCQPFAIGQGYRSRRLPGEFGSRAVSPIVLKIAADEERVLIVRAV